MRLAFVPALLFLVSLALGPLLFVGLCDRDAADLRLWVVNAADKRLAKAGPGYAYLYRWGGWDASQDPRPRSEIEALAKRDREGSIWGSGIRACDHDCIRISRNHARHERSVGFLKALLGSVCVLGGVASAVWLVRKPRDEVGAGGLLLLAAAGIGGVALAAWWFLKVEGGCGRPNLLAAAATILSPVIATAICGCAGLSRLLRRKEDPARSDGEQPPTGS